MTLEKIYVKLQINLFAPFVFYIPSSIVPEDKKDILEKPILKPIFDQFILIDKNGIDTKVVLAESVLPILSKSAILKKNMFMLLKQKKKLSTSEFGFLLDKYNEYLHFFVITSDLMSKNIHTLNNPLSEEVALYFLIQNRAFQEHKKEFQKYLPLNRIPDFKKIDWSKVAKNEFSPLKSIASKEVESELKSILKTKQEPIGKKEKKPPIITDEQSQRYLLETVFNVKLE